MLIDAHCHLDEIKNYIPSMDLIPVTCGHTHSANVKSVLLARTFHIPFVLGIAPQTAQKDSGTIAKLEEWAAFIKNASPRPNAIGEIGLDYHWAKNEEDVKIQKAVFERMLYLAEEMKLPVVIHCRKAESDVLAMLRKRKFKGIMMHFFSGTLKEAKDAVSLGAYVSVPPIRSKSRKEIIKELPLENLLSETDAPAVGRTPKEVMQSVEYIRDAKGISLEEAQEATVRNAVKFFNIKL